MTFQAEPEPEPAPLRERILTALLDKLERQVKNEAYMYSYLHGYEAEDTAINRVLDEMVECCSRSRE